MPKIMRNGFLFTGGNSWLELYGTLTAGQTTVTFTDARITDNSTIEVFTKGDLDYNSISVSTGSVTIAYDAQSSDIPVKVRIS